MVSCSTVISLTVGDPTPRTLVRSQGGCEADEHVAARTGPATAPPASWTRSPFLSPSPADRPEPGAEAVSRAAEPPSAARAPWTRPSRRPVAVRADFHHGLLEPEPAGDRHDPAAARETGDRSSIDSRRGGLDLRTSWTRFAPESRRRLRSGASCRTRRTDPSRRASSVFRELAEPFHVGESPLPESRRRLATAGALSGPPRVPGG